MTKAVQHLLAEFDSLSEAEKQVALVEVWRRTWPEGIPSLPDEAFITAAESLFGDLDAREAQDAKP